MAVDRRKRNANWTLNINADGTVPSTDARLAVLMDICASYLALVEEGFTEV